MTETCTDDMSISTAPSWPKKIAQSGSSDRCRASMGNENHRAAMSAATMSGESCSNR